MTSEVQRFRRRALRRGYKVDEVDAFLDRVEATLASVKTDGVAAAAALERLLDLDSMDVQAWSTLAYVRNVYGWQFGRGTSDAIAALEEWTLPPSFSPWQRMDSGRSPRTP